MTSNQTSTSNTNKIKSKQSKITNFFGYISNKKTVNNSTNITNNNTSKHPYHKQEYKSNNNHQSRNHSSNMNRRPNKGKNAWGNTSSNKNTDNYYLLPCMKHSRWSFLKEKLQQKIKSTDEFISLLYACTPNKKNLSCRGLRQYLDHMISDEERRQFFAVTLPFIQQSCLNLSTEFPDKKIALLYTGVCGSLEFSESQICSLLAMSFFNIHTWKRPYSFPNFNITNLYGYTASVFLEKVKCIIHYFHRCALHEQHLKSERLKNKEPFIHAISFHRYILYDHQLKMLSDKNITENVLKLCKFEMKSGSIEECENTLQIDFANKYIGGGVLSGGCVQEEIRFLINTECLVSLLLCEQMEISEAIAIVGTQQFAQYRGYGNGFEFKNDFEDKTPVNFYDHENKCCKVRNCIVAINAGRYIGNNVHKQFRKPQMKRELIKCFAGFSIPDSMTNLDFSNIGNDDSMGIATGNWGCGVFGGNVELKCCLQWIAATLAERHIKYFAFGDEKCRFMSSFVAHISGHGITVGQLWKYLVAYSDLYEKYFAACNVHNCPSVFEYIVDQYPGEKLSVSPQIISLNVNDNGNDNNVDQTSENSKM